MQDVSMWVGIGAGVLTAISLLPQLIKIIREKKSEAISFGYLFTLLAGLAAWIAYGILKQDYPIILTNSFSFLVNLCLIFLSHKYKQK